eukprot:1462599-Lingulodinium_polyedra.AAC.1
MRGPCTDVGVSRIEFRTTTLAHARVSFASLPPTPMTKCVPVSPYLARFTLTCLATASPPRLAAATMF